MLLLFGLLKLQMLNRLNLDLLIDFQNVVNLVKKAVARLKNLVHLLMKEVDVGVLEIKYVTLLTNISKIEPLIDELSQVLSYSFALVFYPPNVITIPVHDTLEHF